MTQRDAYRLKRRLDLGKPSPGKPQSAQQSQTQVFSPAARPQVPRLAEAFQARRAASQSISATSNGGRGSQEAVDACSSLGAGNKAQTLSG